MKKKFKKKNCLTLQLTRYKLQEGLDENRQILNEMSAVNQSTGKLKMKKVIYKQVHNTLVYLLYYDCVWLK